MAAPPPPAILELRGSLAATLECAICAEPMRTPSTTACGHSFCIECLRAHLRRRAQCPLCRVPCHADPAPNVALGELMQALHPDLEPRSPVAEAERVRQLPVFLSTSVAFPQGVSQLHLFEPRYRLLARRAREGTGEFLIVYVANGSGFPLRADPSSLVGVIGTIMSIEQSRETNDGRWLLFCRGSGRAVVREAWDEADSAALTVARMAPLDEAEADAAAYAPDAAERPLRVSEWEDFGASLLTVLGARAARAQREEAGLVLEAGADGADALPTSALPALRRLSWSACMRAPRATPQLQQALLAAPHTHGRMRALCAAYGAEAHRLRAQSAWRARMRDRLVGPALLLSPVLVVLVGALGAQQLRAAEASDITLTGSLAVIHRLLGGPEPTAAAAPAASHPLGGLSSLLDGLFAAGPWG